jgi:hypothetical protein
MLIKPINLNNKTHFIDIPDKSRRVTSLVFSEGLTNNSQSRAISIDYLLSIN